MRKKTVIVTVTVAAVLIVAATAVGSLLYRGVLHLNSPDEGKDPVRGVDLSSYQGAVDWDLLARQGISFAYIKATEGSSLVDPCFGANWTAASGTGLRIGAYHFFSFESSGETQARLFCDTVKSVPDMLPPVVDVEYYGAFRSEKDVDVPAAKRELRVLIDALTAAYGMKPIIYADASTYRTIVREDFADCDLWFRSVYSCVPSDIPWAFWQYSNRHVLEGYEGKERYIDLNVFAGSADAFEKYPN